MDLEVLDDYVVEHEDNYVLNEEQVRKLIEAKIVRNVLMQELYQPREVDFD